MSSLSLSLCGRRRRRTVVVVVVRLLLSSCRRGLFVVIVVPSSPFPRCLLSSLCRRVVGVVALLWLPVVVIVPPWSFFCHRTVVVWVGLLVLWMCHRQRCHRRRCVAASWLHRGHAVIAITA
jgi:hypothetical protein